MASAITYSAYGGYVLLHPTFLYEGYREEEPVNRVLYRRPVSHSHSLRLSEQDERDIVAYRQAQVSFLQVPQPAPALPPAAPPALSLALPIPIPMPIIHRPESRWHTANAKERLKDIDHQTRRFKTLQAILINQVPVMGNAAILSLPLEILTKIYQKIEDAPSQIAMALSCKHFATIANNTPRAEWNLDRTTGSKQELMKLLEEGMTAKNLRFCPGCVKYRPFTKPYWTHRISGRAEGWTKRAVKCPACTHHLAVGGTNPVRVASEYQ